MHYITPYQLLFALVLLATFRLRQACPGFIEVDDIFQLLPSEDMGIAKFEAAARFEM